jgi:CheY-like chemotaxis protein
MRRATILIIDDNPDVIDLFRRLIDNTIYRVVVATDGTDIDDLTKQVAFDVIFLDIMLPRIDGFEILQTLKSNTTTQHIPVVICSVLDTEELALSLGADAVIAKPPSKSGLDAVLQRWI